MSPKLFKEIFGYRVKNLGKIIEPLDSYSWTFQELLLSRRILYCDTREIAWKYHTENLHNFIGVKCGSTGPSLSSTNIPTAMFEPRTIADAKMALWQGKIWSEIVNEYSKRRITMR